MMKKIKLLILSLFAVEAYAQSPMTISTDFTVTYGTGYPKGETMIWEAQYFEVDETDLTTLGVYEDSNPQVVVNPDKTGINKNDKCLKLTCTDANGFFKMHLPSGFNLNGRRRISMLYKGMGKEFYAQLELVDNFENNEGSNNWKLGAYQDVEGWKRLYFDFTPYDEGTGTGYIKVADDPDVLVFKPKIKDKDYNIQNSTKNDVYYIDEIKVEDVPYAEGYWIHDNTHWPKGTFNAGATPKWNTDACQLPTSSSNGVLHLSGTWLKGQNIVNPDCTTANTESDPKHIAGYWIYEFNEYRDLSWHVKPDQVKLMVFHKDAKLRWPDRGGLLGTNTAGDVAQGYPARFIDNLNVLIFAEKSCILPDEVNNLEANWHNTNAVIHMEGNTWKAWELELTENYPFLNPKEFTVENLIKVHRTMKEGFNALIYPFSLTAAELCCSRVGTVYHHKDDQKLYFVPKTQTEPNVPYIIEGFTPTVEGSTNVSNVYQEFSGGRTVSTVDSEYDYSSAGANGVTFKGNYKEISGEGKWGLVTKSDWQGFMRGGEGSKFKSFRGYIEGLSLSAGAIRLFMTDDEITGIDNVESVTTTDNCWYSLDGRMLTDKPAKSGIYIKNGKKVIIK